jgi:hypothetical protein
MYNPLILIEITEIEMHQPISILYMALQRPHQFVGHVCGILGNVESWAQSFLSAGSIFGLDQ